MGREGQPAAGLIRRAAQNKVVKNDPASGPSIPVILSSTAGLPAAAVAVRFVNPPLPYSARRLPMLVLAIHPTEPELAYFERMPPLGMLWIGGALRRAGHGVEFLDMQVDRRSPAETAAALRPPLVLIGGTSHSRFVAFEAAAAVKEASPETCVVYGGPHASFTARDTLTHIEAIDLVVRGEGEETAVEIAAWAQAGADRGRLPELHGISYRENGAVRDNPDRKPIADLDALGPPDRELVPMAQYHTRMEYLGSLGTSLMSARGCPIACTFCSASAMFGPRYRRRTPRLVVDEIEMLASRYGMQGIKIFDSTFTLNRHHAETVCDELIRRRLNLPWECEIRVGSVDPPLLEKMRRAGCYYVDIGVESGSQRVLDRCVRKQIKLEEAEKLFRWTKELGLMTKVFFTVGHPGETAAEGRMTNRFLRRNRRYVRLAGYHAGVKVYPGTEVERFATEHDLLPAGFRWSAPYVNLDQRRLFRPVDNIPILLQPNLGIRELRRLRIGFILDRLGSPRFIAEKVARVLRGRSVGGITKQVAGGLMGRSSGGRAEP